MTLTERDQVYVEHMLECIARIQRYVGNGPEQFMQSDLVQDAVIRNLQVLAESSRRLSAAVKNSTPDIDWRAITGFRNILVHDYLGLDLPVIWLVIEQDLPPLKSILEELQAGD